MNQLQTNLMNVCYQQKDFVDRSFQFKQEYFELCSKYEVRLRFQPHSEFQIVDIKDWSGTAFEVKE